MTRFLLAFALLLPSPARADHELESRDHRNGQALYKEHCASCHGAELEGTAELAGSPERTGSRTRRRTMRPVTPGITTTGFCSTTPNSAGRGLMEARGITGIKSGMPGFVDVMSDEEIWDVLAYIRSTWPDHIREIQSGRNPPHEP